jgi:hypothetical protein
MTSPVLSYVLPGWIGRTPSAHALPISTADADFACSIKAQLQSGEIMVSGDQWPVFIYAGCKFDPEDPWEGMFRSTILVSVS